MSAHAQSSDPLRPLSSCQTACYPPLPSSSPRVSLCPSLRPRLRPRSRSPSAPFASAPAPQGLGLCVRLVGFSRRRRVRRRLCDEPRRTRRKREFPDDQEGQVVRRGRDGQGAGPHTHARTRCAGRSAGRGLLVPFVRFVFVFVCVFVHMLWLGFSFGFLPHQCFLCFFLFVCSRVWSIPDFDGSCGRARLSDRRSPTAPSRRLSRRRLRSCRRRGRRRRSRPRVSTRRYP